MRLGAKSTSGDAQRARRRRRDDDRRRRRGGGEAPNLTRREGGQFFGRDALRFESRRRAVSGIARGPCGFAAAGVQVSRLRRAPSAVHHQRPLHRREGRRASGRLVHGTHAHPVRRGETRRDETTARSQADNDSRAEPPTASSRDRGRLLPCRRRGLSSGGRLAGRCYPRRGPARRRGWRGCAGDGGAVLESAAAGL